MLFLFLDALWEEEMEEKEKKQSFDRRITMIDDCPHIYITPLPEKRELPGEGGKRAPAFFFGHHIGKLLDPGKAEAEEFVPIDKELESSLETVRKKLEMIKPRSPYRENRISGEEIKHRHFIEERNKAQEALFEDIIRHHSQFGTGLVRGDLLLLHELMQMEAAHEGTCSQEESIHELVECNLLTFLRRKTQEKAWKKLEDNIVRFHIEFPIPPSMVHHADPVRKEKVTEEKKKSAQEEFLTMPAQQLAELLLGNVPIWVYSYPGTDTYLWKLTLLQGVAAGLAGNLLMKYLSVWEENSSEMLDKIQEEFADRIEELRRQGEFASTLTQVLSVSKELQRISKEEMPERIWKYIRPKLEDPSSRGLK
jgi:hypothetical protein